jgi:mRNA interferase MazF
LIISNKYYNLGTSMTLVCPITTADNGFPLHFRLPDKIDTRGFIVAEQLRAFDLAARRAKRIEKLDDPVLAAAITECIRSFV